MLKSALRVLTAFMLLVAGVLAYLAVTFDPADLEQQVVRFVQEKTGRTLHVAGAIELSFWPDLGVSVGSASLSERDSRERFAQIENVRLRLKLLPLLSRELVAEEIRIKRAHVSITRFPDGRLNVDDLLQGTGGALQFDIARTRIEHSIVTFDDKLTGRHYVFSDIALDAGRIAPVASAPIALSFNASDAAQTLELAAVLESRLVLSMREQHYTLDETTLEVKGRVHGITDLVARARGSVRADGRARELALLQFSGVVNANVSGQVIEAEAHVSKAALDVERVRAEAIRLDARARGTAGTVRVRIALPRTEQNGGSLISEDAELQLDVERDAHALEVRAATRIEADFGRRALELPRLVGRFTVTGPRVPGRRIKGVVSGAAVLDAVRETVQVEIAGNVDASRVRAAIGSVGFSRPQYRFDVSIDELDLDRFGTAGDGSSTGASWNVSALEALPARGTLQIGVLRASGGRATDVKLVLR